jgi:hypothetical protein
VTREEEIAYLASRIEAAAKRQKLRPITITPEMERSLAFWDDMPKPKKKRKRGKAA